MMPVLASSVSTLRATPEGSGVRESALVGSVPSAISSASPKESLSESGERGLVPVSVPLT